MNTESRRCFLSRAAPGVAGIGLYRGLAARPAFSAANETIAVAVIGFNGMGMGHVHQIARHPGARVAALCDVDDNVMARGVSEVRNIEGQTPRQTRDFRELVDNPSIDGVTIATPHHWHWPIALPAVIARKDVYVEKPASHVFQEGRLLVDATNAHQRIVQHGTQMRSSPVTEQAGNALRSRILGEIKMAKAWNVQDRSFAKPLPNRQPPDGVDYER